MINKKLSELFMRKDKESGKKEDHKSIACFDQSYFHCRLVCRGINTDLIQLHAEVKENGQPLDQIRCKWFLKNPHDFKEIEDVTSEYYQPCLDDVGSVVCVQVEPFIEGKKYAGIIIMKESPTIELDLKLDEDLNKFLQRKQQRFDGRLEAVFSQNQKYEAFELPTEIKLEITENHIHLYENGRQFQSIKIDSEYPNVEFIRKSFNSIILNFNDHESYKLSFNNNFQRDLFTLITRTLSAHSTSMNMGQQIQPVIEHQVLKLEEKQPEEVAHQIIEVDTQQSPLKVSKVNQSTQYIENSSKTSIKDLVIQTIQVKSTQRLQGDKNVILKQKQKTEQPKQNNTHLILKLDEQGKELKLFKRQLDELRVNYNIQKQSKKSLEGQNQQLRKTLGELKKKLEESQNLNKKMAQVSEDNRFYKNEISIIRKELKASKQKIKFLEERLENKKVEQSNQQKNKLQSLTKQCNDARDERYQAIKAKENMEHDLERIRQQYEKLENQNLLFRKKLESLQNQRNLPQKQVQSQHERREKAQLESQKKVIQLQMKLKNLEMLLRYKSNQGDPSSSGFQLLANKLTQTISQKQFQINQYKKINKSLLEQLKQLKQRHQ